MNDSEPVAARLIIDPTSGSVCIDGCTLILAAGLTKAPAAAPNAKSQGGWPTREAIDEEVAFMPGELRQQLDRPFRSGQERFPWAVVWAEFDAKGFTASTGLRYEP